MEVRNIISILASQFHDCFCVRISVTMAFVVNFILSCSSAAASAAADHTD